MHCIGEQTRESWIGTEDYGLWDGTWVTTAWVRYECWWHGDDVVDL